MHSTLSNSFEILTSHKEYRLNESSILVICSNSKQVYGASLKENIISSTLFSLIFSYSLKLNALSIFFIVPLRIKLLILHLSNAEDISFISALIVTKLLVI